MMVSGVHTDFDKKKVSVGFRDKRRYWVEVDKKYHRFFNDQSMEEDYWEDLDDYIDGQTNKKITERIYKKLSQIEAVKNDIQKKGKVVDLNKRTA
jgi:hypothetical protein